MVFQTVFKRYELKYMLTLEQKAKVLATMEPYMKLDKYGRTTIRNIYYDTDTYLLIRRSIEKPAYKEKLRIRSYSRQGQYGVCRIKEKISVDCIQAPHFFTGRRSDGLGGGKKALP